MNNFQLTENHRWYVNKNGDRCEAALLNGEWVAVWDNARTSHHTPTGESISRSPDNFDFEIVAMFEGWLFNPFAFRPDWVEYATSNGLGEFELWGNKPSIDGFEWFDFEEGESTFMGESKYTGNWRNSLTHREEWE